MVSSKLLVKCGQSSVIMAGEGGEVGVGDLAVAKHLGEVDVVIPDCVGPEGVALVTGEKTQHARCLTTAQAFTNEQAEQGALSDGAGGKRLTTTGPPASGGPVVDVVAHGQGD